MIETMESEWSKELDEEVEIRYVEAFEEYDVYLGGQFAVTVATLEQVDTYLGLYCVRKGA